MLFGTSFLSMKSIVSVPSTTPGNPCANLPISFPNALPHISWYSGCLIRCLYSSRSPIVPSRTDPTISHRSFNVNLLPAVFCGVSGVVDISMHANNVSCVMDGVVLDLDLVLYAGRLMLSSWVM